MQFCFADNTTVWAKVAGESFQEVPIQDVKPGVELLASVDDKPYLTKAVSNRRFTAATDAFLQFRFASGHLRVTENHNMLVLRSGVSMIMQASDVLVGDVMLGMPPRHVAESSIVPWHFSKATVEEVQDMQFPYKNQLITEHGTLLANNVVVSTICDEPSYEKYASASEALAAWKRDHAFADGELV